MFHLLNERRLEGNGRNKRTRERDVKKKGKHFFVQYFILFDMSLSYTWIIHRDKKPITNYYGVGFGPFSSLWVCVNNWFKLELLMIIVKRVTNIRTLFYGQERVSFVVDIWLTYNLVTDTVCYVNQSGH